MTDSGPETIDRQDFRERLLESDVYMQRNYRQEIIRYRNGRRLSRWLIGKYPEVADYVAYVEAQESVTEARRRAYANEGRIIVP